MQDVFPAPQAPGFATTCNSCGQEIEAGNGQRCTVCTDFDLCNKCAAAPVGVNHPHPLVVSARSQAPNQAQAVNAGSTHSRP